MIAQKIIVGAMAFIVLLGVGIYETRTFDVSTEFLTQVVRIEVRKHWSVKNTGQPVRAFPHSDRAEDWFRLSQQAAEWFKEDLTIRKSQSLERYPNIFWQADVKGAQREDFGWGVRITANVQVFGTDCYVKEVSAQRCPGIPSITTQETVEFDLRLRGEEWLVTRVNLLADYLFPRDDKLFWLCLADGDDSDCPIAPTD